MGRRIIFFLQFTIFIPLFLVLNFSCSEISLIPNVRSLQSDLFTGISPDPKGECVETLSPVLRWDAVPGAAFYEVQLADSSYMLNSAEILTVSDNSYTFSSELSRGDLVYWRVRAVNAASQAGVWSETFLFYVPEYFILETGPAGGYVFYHDEFYSEDILYLEAAPAETEWTEAAWGGDETDIEGSNDTAVGTGEKNTEDIVKHVGTGTTYAAQLCDNLEYGGFDDWFLPSKDELNLMYQILRVNELGNFAASNYWSSSEFDPWSAWRQYFNDGNQSGRGKNYICRVRAVRSF